MVWCAWCGVHGVMWRYDIQRNNTVQDGIVVKTQMVNKAPVVWPGCAEGCCAHCSRGGGL